MKDMIAALVLAACAHQTTMPKEVHDLLEKMHAAYSKIHSVDMTVAIRVGTPRKHYNLTSRIRYVEPNLFREDISESKASDPTVASVPGFTFICDGKKVQSIGRADGMNGIKPFSKANVQDYGAPVYKEALCVWDWDRQWSPPRGGAEFHYEFGSATVEGQKLIELGETVPDKSERFAYDIDPDAYLIKRTLYFMREGTEWIPAGNYLVTDMKINPKIDRSIFVLRK